MQVFNNCFPRLMRKKLAVAGLTVLGIAYSSLTYAQADSQSASPITETDQAPQAAQSKPDETLQFPEAPAELSASTKEEVAPAATKLREAARALQTENPAAARKLAGLESKIRETETGQKKVNKPSAAQRFAAKVLTNKLKRMEKKLDIKKAEAPAANNTLVIVGAVLALLGLIFLFINGLVGLLFLIIGLVLVIVGALQ